MRIARIHIENFRNFRNLDVEVERHLVIVGENTVGKSNLLFALRLIFDPTLSDAARQLRQEDFWDGLKRPLTRNTVLRYPSISPTLMTMTSNLKFLGEHLVKGEPMVARLTYRFQALATLEGEPTNDSDYEFHLFGGDRPENRLGADFRRRMPLDFSVRPAKR